MSAARVLIHTLAVVAGAVAGLLGSFKFGYTTASLPIGLFVSLLLELVVFVAAGLAARSRAAAALAGAGAFLVSLLVSSPRSEGDVVVPATTLGYSWLVGGLVTAVAAVAVPYAGRRDAPFSKTP